MDEEVLDLLPDVSVGAAGDENAYRVGIPLQSENDPRRSHKKAELAELHQLAQSCTTALLTDQDFWGHERVDESGTELLKLVVDNGYRKIVTMEHVFAPGDAPPVDESQSSVGVLDPGAITTRHGVDPSCQHQHGKELLTFLRDNRGVALPILTTELLDKLDEAIQNNFPEDAQLLRSALWAGSVNAHSPLDLKRRKSDLATSSSSDASADAPEYVRVAA